MKNINDFDEIIERYNEGELKGEELKLFLNELKTNPLLARDFDLHKKIDEAIMMDDQDNFRKKLDEIYRSLELLTKKQKFFNKRRRYFLLAASIVIVLGIIFVISSLTKDKPKDIAEEAGQGIKDTAVITKGRLDLITIIPDSLKETKDTLMPGQKRSRVKDNEESEELASENKSRKVKPGEFVGESYRLHPALVGMIGAITRMGYFENISPPDSLLYKSGEEMVFKWKTGIEKELYLEIVDSRTEPVFRSGKLEGGSYTYAQSLSPGIYLFRYRTKEEVVFTGLFFVN